MSVVPDMTITFLKKLPIERNLMGVFEILDEDLQRPNLVFTKQVANAVAIAVGNKDSILGPRAWDTIFSEKKALIEAEMKENGVEDELYIDFAWLNTFWRYGQTIQVAMRMLEAFDQLYLRTFVTNYQ